MGTQKERIKNNPVGHRFKKIAILDTTCQEREYKCAKINRLQQKAGFTLSVHHYI